MKRFKAGKAEIEVKNSAPKFDGENPQQWISNIQAYFNRNRIPENQRLQIVELNLEGDALEWYGWMKTKTKNLFYNYHDLLEKIRVCFEPSIDFAEYRERLSKLTQKGSVAEFQAEFEEILRYIVTGASEAQLVTFFVDGLKHDLKERVQEEGPRTILEAFALATYYEGLSRTTNRIDRSNLGWTGLKPAKPKPPSRWKRLSAAEMQEKRSKGLCFNCDQRFNPKQPCPCRVKSQGVEF